MHTKMCILNDFQLSWLFDFSKFKPLSLPGLCPGIPSGFCSPPPLAPVLLVLVWPPLTPVGTGATGVATSDPSGNLPRTERGKVWFLRLYSYCFSYFSLPCSTSSHPITFSPWAFIHWRNIYFSTYQQRENHPSSEKTYRCDAGGR